MGSDMELEKLLDNKNIDINNIISEESDNLPDASEINHRPISEIPHPFVIESMERFKWMSLKDKKKIYFIHFNHTNPLLKKESPAYKKVLAAGYQIAQQGQRFML